VDDPDGGHIYDEIIEYLETKVPHIRHLICAMRVRLWIASETFTSKPSDVDSCSAIVALDRMAFRTWSPSY
jgi:hypothetical protein